MKMKKMKQCKKCSKEFPINDKSCPGCGAKNKKPMYKIAICVWGLWAVIFILGFMTVGTADDSDSGNVESVQEASQNNENAIVENKSEDKVPSEYEYALESAKSYSDILYMSKAGIYDQLISDSTEYGDKFGDNFSTEAAQYAVDNLEEVDWKKNALESAKLYSEVLYMSKAAIYDQLISEVSKFTPEEAQYAVDNAGVNWKENALKTAKTYQEIYSMSPSAIYDELISGEKFTPEEAQYAIDNLE